MSLLSGGSLVVRRCCPGTHLALLLLPEGTHVAGLRRSTAFARRETAPPRFVRSMRRLNSKGGWFVPVSVLLNYVSARQDVTDVERQRRRLLEQRWLWEKLFRGTS